MTDTPMPSSSPCVGSPLRSRSTARQAIAERGKGDQDDLDQRGQRLRLAMAVAMLLVRRHRRPANAEEGDEAGDEVERRVGEAAEHRDRAGVPAGVAFERDQEERHGDAGKRGAAGQLGALAAGVAVMMAVTVMMAAAHG